MSELLSQLLVEPAGERVSLDQEAQLRYFLTQVIVRLLLLKKATKLRQCLMGCS